MILATFDLQISLGGGCHFGYATTRPVLCCCTDTSLYPPLILSLLAMKAIVLEAKEGLT